MIRFLCLEGMCVGEIFEFDKDSVLLGRGAECDVVVDDHACSRRHVRIQVADDGYEITQLDEDNHLLVNGLRVKGAFLNPGNRFKLGEHLFILLPEVQKRKKVDDEGSLVDIERAQRLMHIAYQASQAINTTLGSEDVYTLITENVFENFTDVERVCILRKESEGQLELVRNVSKVDGRKFQVSHAIIKRVEEERTGILASDALADDRFSASDSIARMELRSLMCVPLITRNRFLGAIYVENFSRPRCFEEQDLEVLTLLGNQAAWAIENSVLYADLQASVYETVRSLCNALEAKDKYTRGHSDRVARLATGIGHGLGLKPERIEKLCTAAQLHDIGKIAIRERIIGKNGRLTREEYEAIKQHPQLGVDILKPIRFLKPVLPFILHHHERYNGRGYPDGLRGEEISLEARILNLADAFDAMTTQRSYNVPKTISEALEQCEREAGRSFDAECVKALHAHLEKDRDQESPSEPTIAEDLPKVEA